MDHHQSIIFIATQWASASTSKNNGLPQGLADSEPMTQARHGFFLNINLCAHATEPEFSVNLHHF